MNGTKTPTLVEAIEEMITTYHDVNGPIDEYDGNPSSSVYSKHIAKNRPFIVRNGCSDWAAAGWNAEYLQTKMAGKFVKVAETPLGWVSRSSILNNAPLIGGLEMQTR